MRRNWIDKLIWLLDQKSRKLLIRIVKTRRGRTLMDVRWGNVKSFFWKCCDEINLHTDWVFARRCRNDLVILSRTQRRPSSFHRYLNSQRHCQRRFWVLLFLPDTTTSSNSESWLGTGVWYDIKCAHSLLQSLQNGYYRYKMATIASKYFVNARKLGYNSFKWLQSLQNGYSNY